MVCWPIARRTFVPTLLLLPFLINNTPTSLAAVTHLPRRALSPSASLPSATDAVVDAASRRSIRQPAQAQAEEELTPRGRRTRKRRHDGAVAVDVAVRQLPDGSKRLLLWNGTSLPSVLRDHAIPNTTNVILTTFDVDDEPGEEGALPFLVHLYGTLDKVQLAGHLIAACARHASCVSAWHAGLPVYLPWHSALNPRKPIWPVNLKWLVTAHMLRHGYGVIFMDFDLAVRRPFTQLLTAVPHDVIALSDYRGSGEEFFQAWQLPIDERRRCSHTLDVRYTATPHPCVSTGFFHLAPSHATAELAARVFNRSHQGEWEQAVFNELLVYYSLPQPFPLVRQRLHLETFPVPEAINTVLLEELQQAPEWDEQQEARLTVLHCGYVHSLQDKREALQRHDVWEAVYQGAAGPLPMVNVTVHVSAEVVA